MAAGAPGQDGGDRRGGASLRCLALLMFAEETSHPDLWQRPPACGPPTQTCGTGFQPVGHGQDARATVLDAVAERGLGHSLRGDPWSAHGHPRRASGADQKIPHLRKCGTIARGRRFFQGICAPSAGRWRSLPAQGMSCPDPWHRLPACGRRAGCPCHGAGCSCRAWARTFPSRGSVVRTRPPSPSVGGRSEDSTLAQVWNYRSRPPLLPGHLRALGRQVAFAPRTRDVLPGPVAQASSLWATGRVPVPRCLAQLQRAARP